MIDHRVHRKQPLDSALAQRSRRRRVEEKRILLTQWAEEEGVPVSALLGFLLYLENWNQEKSLSTVGWKIFMKEEVTGVPSVTMEEAIWLLERSFMSQAVYLEVRLRFKDRISFPAVLNIRAENKRHRPCLEEYKHGVKARPVEVPKKRRLKRRLLQAPQAPFKAPIHSKCCIGGFRDTGLTLVIVLRCY